jgi:hypothetical protein
MLNIRGCNENAKENHIETNFIPVRKAAISNTHNHKSW